MKRFICALLLALFASTAFAQVKLRQSTAVDVAFGPAVDATDGVTAETGLTISQADVRLKKNGGSWAQKNDTNACTHEENGWYECALNTTDTDTVGVLVVNISEAGALPIWRTFQVIEEAVYDADYAASATGLRAANVTQFGGAAATSSGGRPEVNTSHWGGTAVASATVNANATQFSGDSGVVDRLEAILDGTCGSYPEIGVARGVGCTAASATSTTLVMDTSAAFADDTAIGMTVVACGSTQGYCQARVVTDNTGSNDTLTVDTWTVTPSGTVSFTLFDTAPSSGNVNVVTVEGTDATNYYATLDDATNALIGTPANLGGGATLAANASDIEAQTDDIGAAGAGLTALPDVDLLVEALIPLGIELTADSGTSTTIVDAALTQATDGWFSGTGVVFTSGTLAGQSACVTNFTASSDTLTFSPAATATVVGTQNYYLLAMPKCQTGDTFARVGAPAGASTSADIADLRADIPSALVGGRMDSSTGAMAADVLTDAASAASFETRLQTEADDALVARFLDRLFATDYDPASKPGVATALLNELVENDGGVSRYTANALEQGPSGGGGVADWTADERTAIRAILGIPGSGTAPTDPSSGILNTIRNYVDTEVAALQSDTDDIQTRLPAALVSGRMDTSVGAMAANVITNAVIATDALGSDELALSAVNKIGDLIIEDQGSISLRCSQAIILAALMGDVSTSSGTSTWEEPSGVETRAVSITISNGNRTSTITCPTY